MKKTYKSFAPLFRVLIQLSGIITILCLVVLINSCNSDANNKSRTEAGDTLATAFKPNPQKVEKHEVTTMEIGSRAVDFKLPDITGKFYTLSDFDKADILVIIFTCTHCPTAQAYENRIIKFTNDYKDKGVSVVAIMPNSNFGLLLEECGYTDLDDSYESMVIRAKDKKFNFPYLYDGDDEAVSIQYGPTATPHAFVFGKDRKLAYTGRLDASEKPGTGDAEDLRAAVDALIKGEPVKTTVNKAFGCSIKWGWKSELADKVNLEWNNKPVTLEKISESGISKLIANDSKKLRLINVWATWCGPCVIEFPELVNIHRMFYGRDFEFISISADKPDQSEKALEFLKSKHAAFQNFIFDSDDKYALIEAVDPKWNGALPYSILVEPGGKIVYSIQGAIDLHELRKKIVENPLIGRYF